jgi:hypothetical protein
MNLSWAYLVVGGALVASLVAGCSDSSRVIDGTGASGGADASGGSSGNAGSAGAGGSAGTAGAGGSSGSAGNGGGAGGSILDAGLDSGVCAPPAQLGYVMPGCNGTVQPVCEVFNNDACASIGCGCNGQTISGACGWFFEPYAYGGECNDAGPDASAP